MTEYVHGYGTSETERLQCQAQVLTDIIHDGLTFPPNARILEVGCGTGAQTRELTRRHATAHVTAIDVSNLSLSLAREAMPKQVSDKVEFMHADVFDMPFEPASFDVAFLCFVLEHVTDQAAALRMVLQVLKPTGVLIAVEGDHGSALFYPESDIASRAVDCQTQLQECSGGSTKTGRRLYPLLTTAGFKHVDVEPRSIYVDGSRPDLAEQFTRGTFTAMVEGVSNEAVNQGLIRRDDFNKGVADLSRTADPDGVFFYTFFRAIASNQSSGLPHPTECHP